MAGTGTLYDFPQPQVSGQNIIYDRYLNNPVRIYRPLRTLVQQRLIGDRLLTGRVDLTGTGSGVYEVAEAILPDFLPLVVPPLDEYALTTFTPGTPAQVIPFKWGQAFDMSDKAIAHGIVNLLRRNTTKVANRLVTNSDSITLAAIASLITQSQAAQNGAWGTTGATPFLDIELAIAKVDSLNMGYNVDTVVLTPTKFAQLMATPTVLAGTPREDNANNVQLTGNMREFAGLTIWKTTNMPAGWSGMVLDSEQLGSQAYEALPSVAGVSYSGNAGQVETAVVPLPTKDGVRVQSRIVKAPMVQEPGCAVQLTVIL
ncbi:hypothetical protein [uncultured Jatrophihabitans sp.]|uniref:phage major capsid protein n=1 Tax=uncultured Jatrophihabitans sp. TaxID=1610747 RepID=UPI0035CA547A